MNDKPTKAEISRVMANLGRKSGHKKPKEHFKMMAKARWDKQKAKPVEEIIGSE